MRYLLLIFLALVWGCSSKQVKEEHASGLHITEIHPNRESALMKQNVLQLAQVYDLGPFLYTKVIHITPKGVNQSHPVLTLNVEHSAQPYKILSVFLHEEFHWLVSMYPKNLNQSIVQLKNIFPNQQKQVYIHIVVCYLEYKALRMYLGEKLARKIILDFVRREKLRPWVYTQVLTKNQLIGKLLKKNGLIPKILL